MRNGGGIDEEPVRAVTMAMHVDKARGEVLTLRVYRRVCFGPDLGIGPDCFDQAGLDQASGKT